MIGALLGLGTQMYSNALRKLPYMRRTFLSNNKTLIFSLPDQTFHNPSLVFDFYY